MQWGFSWYGSLMFRLLSFSFSAIRWWFRLRIKQLIMIYSTSAINKFFTSTILYHVKRKPKERTRTPSDEAGLAAFARLKEIRAQKKITQEALAYSSGSALSQIARIETARTNPTLSTIFVIARGIEDRFKGTL